MFFPPGLRVGILHKTAWQCKRELSGLPRALKGLHILDQPPPPLPISQGPVSAQPKAIRSSVLTEGRWDIDPILREQPWLQPGSAILLVLVYIRLKTLSQFLMEIIPSASPLVEVPPGPTQQEPFTSLMSPAGRAGGPECAKQQGWYH